MTRPAHPIGSGFVAKQGAQASQPVSLYLSLVYLMSLVLVHRPMRATAQHEHADKKGERDRQYGWNELCGWVGEWFLFSAR